MQTGYTKKPLVQPTTIVNQTWWYARIPYKYPTLTTQNFIFPHASFLGLGSSILRDYGDSDPDSIPDSPWMSSASSSPAGPGMIGSGVELV
jgi:hypothetical protein